MMITNEGAFMKNKISDKNMFQNFEVKAYWFLNDNQNSHNKTMPRRHYLKITFSIMIRRL